MTQHASLSPDRWSAFSLDEQILMIGNEMNRAMRLLRPEDGASLALAYERVLRLVDLTVEVQPRPTLRRELLRWRDLIAELYIRPEPDAATHAAAFRSLLQLTPEAAKQLPFVLPTWGHGGLRPGVDLDDSASLLDLMERGDDPV